MKLLNWYIAGESVVPVAALEIRSFSRFFRNQNIPMKVVFAVLFGCLAANVSAFDFSDFFGSDNSQEEPRHHQHQQAKQPGKRIMHD